MEIRIVTEAISMGELAPLALAWYDDMIKGVVDVEREIVALGGEYHMDANVCLRETVQNKMRCGVLTFTPANRAPNGLSLSRLSISALLNTIRECRLRVRSFRKE